MQTPAAWRGAASSQARSTRPRCTTRPTVTVTTSWPKERPMFPEIDSYYQVREWFGFVQEIRHEGGPLQDEPLIKATAGVVIANPFAGRYVEDLSPLTAP